MLIFQYCLFKITYLYEKYTLQKRIKYCIHPYEYLYLVLLHCCITNKYEIVKYLIEVKELKFNIYNNLPLKLACEYNHIELVNYLINKKEFKKYNLLIVVELAYRYNNIDLFNKYSYVSYKDYENERHIGVLFFTEYLYHKEKFLKDLLFY